MFSAGPTRLCQAELRAESRVPAPGRCSSGKGQVGRLHWVSVEATAAAGEAGKERGPTSAHCAAIVSRVGMGRLESRIDSGWAADNGASRGSSGASGAAGNVSTGFGADAVVVLSGRRSSLGHHPRSMCARSPVHRVNLFWHNAHRSVAADQRHEAHHECWP